MADSTVKEIADLEFRTELAPQDAHKLLGLGYSTYSQYRTAARPLPNYIKNSIQAIIKLRASDLNAMIKEHVYGKVAHD